MKREEFVGHLTDLVNDYINYYVGSDDDPQIRVNPVSLNTEFVDDRDKMEDIEYSDEAIEEAAAAEDSAAEDATDFQAAQNPDYYTLKSLIRTDTTGKAEVDTKAISAVADVYFR